MEELKRCPFCGGEATYREFVITGNNSEGFNGKRFLVSCKNRGCYLRDEEQYDRGYLYEDDAVKAWNKRINPK